MTRPRSDRGAALGHGTARLRVDPAHPNSRAPGPRTFRQLISTISRATNISVRYRFSQPSGGGRTHSTAPSRLPVPRLLNRSIDASRLRVPRTLNQAIKPPAAPICHAVAERSAASCHGLAPTLPTRRPAQRVKLASTTVACGLAGPVETLEPSRSPRAGLPRGVQPEPLCIGAAGDGAHVRCARFSGIVVVSASGARGCSWPNSEARSRSISSPS